MEPSRPDVVIVGPLANLDVMLAEVLSRQGFDCVVARPPAERPFVADKAGIELRAFRIDRVVTCRSATQFFRLTRRAKCALMFGGVLPYYVHHWWMLGRIGGMPPMGNFTTGSDMLELADAKGRAAWRYRSVLKRSVFTAMIPYPVALEKCARFPRTNFAFVRLPFPFPAAASRRRAPGPVTFLHAARIDWGLADADRARRSTKGSDRFFRAFARAVQQGVDVRCIVVDRGPDRLSAREMLAALGVCERVEWCSEVPRAALPDLFARADVVVDQFDVGGLGLTAIEAMAYAKPVMTWVDTESAMLAYEEAPPVLNCRTEDEILATIVASTDPDELAARGTVANTWVRRNHGDELNIEPLVFRIASMAGLRWPLATPQQTATS